MNLRALRTAVRSVRAELLRAIDLRMQRVGWGADLQARISLQRAIDAEGAERVRERYARSWFLRLCALRYMELNGWLAHSSVPARATEQEQDLLLAAECRRLERRLPWIFSCSDPLTLMLMPDARLDPDSARGLIAASIPNDLWLGKPLILGTLYELYSAEQRGTWNGGVPAAKIDTVTCRYTPEWLARLLVENSLGALWIEEQPESRLREMMPYYRGQPGNSRPSGRNLSEYTVMDPCCGAGQVLLAAYDLLHGMYCECGWDRKAAARRILEHHLHGLDIDEHAIAIAAFTLVMTALADDPELLDGPPLRIPLAAVSPETVAGWHAAGSAVASCPAAGSLLRPSARLDALCSQGISPCAARAMLTRTYRCVATNPPYLSIRFMDKALRAFAEEHYPSSKGDLYAMFIQRALELTASDGCAALLTMHGWMFLPSFRPLRETLLRDFSLRALFHLGARAFESISGEVVQTTAFVIDACKHEGRAAVFIDLRAGNAREKERGLIEERVPVSARTPSAFLKFPGASIAYWSSPELRGLFAEAQPLGRIVQIRQGLATGDNGYYVRRWYEVDRAEIAFGARSLAEVDAAGKQWVPYNKGGGTRRWYGNQEHVIRFDAASRAALARQGNHMPSRDFYFRPAVTWSLVSSNRFAARLQEAGSVFDVNGMSLFSGDAGEEEALLLLAFLNSAAASELLSVLNPTLAFQAGNLKQLPYPRERLRGREQPLIARARRAVELSQGAWDARETSWNYSGSPLLAPEYGAASLRASAERYRQDCVCRSEELARLEQENDLAFAELCGLQVSGREPAAEPPSLSEIAVDFLSFAVGCMFGRFPLPGRQSADKDMSPFLPLNQAGILVKDLVSRLEELLQSIWPDEVEGDLTWLAAAAGGDAEVAARHALRQWFLRSFYPEHCKRYRKRPIYFLLTSGPRRAFQALLYPPAMTPDGWQRLRAKCLDPLRDGHSASTPAAPAAARRELEKLYGQVERAANEQHSVNPAEVSA